ncbi:MAG TPA: transcriptional repressor [Rariglobus sp.]|jgi:Fur family ferric uptake transcriptional regulator|nr:transcriptional repressor [Rariglobus sp.]
MIASTQTNHPLVDLNTSLTQSLEQACARLKAAGLRITQPRIAILTALLGQTHPVTIEQIHENLNDRSCDLVTVYRCLAAFEELNLVRRSYFHNGTSLYQIQMGTEPVYHVVSKNDNTVTALPAELTEELRTVIQKIEAELKTRGYTDVSHMAEFFATAPTNARREAVANA